MATNAPNPSKIPIHKGKNPAASSKTAAKSNDDSEVDNQFFFEDEVFQITKGRCKFGMVVETFETYEDSDEEYEVVNKGQVRVAWYPDGKEDLLSENDVHLVDRTLMPGDVVRRLVPGKEAQRGYCREINMCADIRIHNTNYVIKKVNTERFRMVGNYPCDSVVCLNSWVGSTRDIEETAILRSANGAKIRIPSKLFWAFEEKNIARTQGIYDPVIFFPGNIVYGRLVSMENVELLTPDIPLQTNKKGKLIKEKFTIESVSIKSIYVQWQCKALSDDNTQVMSSAIQLPSCIVTGEDINKLKPLNLFESCMLQIADRNFLDYKQSDDIVLKSDWDREQALKYKMYLLEQHRDGKINLAAGSLGGNTSHNNSHQHSEKLKKKHSSLDMDKSLKPKKFIYKMDKHFNLNKEKSHSDNSSKNTQSKIISNKSSDTEWISDYDEDDELDKNEDKTSGGGSTADENSSTTCTISACSSPSPHFSPNHAARTRFKKKITKNIKKVVKPFTESEFTVEEGQELATETLLVYSTANVVWQDGSFESDIPSTSLYPIHHLDNHEFFPGDFVISSADENDSSFREYGVIQTVDHKGRIATVKWFTTYTASEEPKPTYNGETEVSVYDLKDHPDFQYRPGTMVIRVANFVGEDATSTAGQIIDNYPNGRVKVWWVDGHVSMCWPQDLFEVGQYDNIDGEDSDDSWETESEESEYGADSSPNVTVMESHVITNISRAATAISRLETIFTVNPSMQNQEVMRKLLIIFKGCRYLDRILETTFFHEDNFMGYIERVRRGSCHSVTERVQDRKNRLFNDVPSTGNCKQQQQQQTIDSPSLVQKSSGTTATTKESNAKLISTMSSTPLKCPSIIETENTTQFTEGLSIREVLEINYSNNDYSTMEEQTDLNTELAAENLPNTNIVSNSNVNANTSVGSPSLNAKQNFVNYYHSEKNKLLSAAMHNIEKATEKTNYLKSLMDLIHSQQQDSGNYSRNENGNDSSVSNASSSDNLNKITNEEPKPRTSHRNMELGDESSSDVICARFCSILKVQLEKCMADIRQKYYQVDNINLMELANSIEMDNHLTVLYINETTEKLKNVLGRNDTPLESQISTESQLDDSVDVPLECFQLLSNAPITHKFISTTIHPNNPQQFYKAVQREHKMLKNSLPPGVSVRVYEDRIDLISVMMEGPKNTPYEDGLFFFDIQLCREYPKNPPVCHYISFCSDRLNPNLYEDGKVCVSLLGTWNGRNTEVWGPNSTILQLLVSIQGLILVAEPYYNEAGFEKQKNTPQGKENSQTYNEMAIIKLIQATIKLLQHPIILFREEIMQYYRLHGYGMFERLKSWIDLSKTMADKVEDNKEDATSSKNLQANSTISDSSNIATNSYSLPDFPLVPASRGFCITLMGLLNSFKTKLDAIKLKSTTTINNCVSDVPPIKNTEN